MIARLRGVVAEVGSDRLVIDVNGVGYEVFVATRTTQAARLDLPMTLFVYTAVREDAITLYGFASAAEKECFVQLIGVNQVGPRIALSVLSTLSADMLVQAINLNDIRTLSSVSGVGKKTAERMVLELKGKLTAVPTSAAAAVPDDMLPAALLQLGFKPGEIDTVLLKLTERGFSGATLDVRVAEALRIFGEGL